jgi:hypothetical protein
MTEHIPDGINEVVTNDQDSNEIMLLPSEMYDEPVEMMRSDPRSITERRRSIVISANQKERVLDQLETGSLDYVMMRIQTVLPSGSDGATPENLALFLQLDGFAQGGFESIYDPALNGSTIGVKISTLSELNLPEQFGMWFLTVDQTNTKVVVFRGRNNYNHRIRLDLMNTHATLDIHVEFVEIARKRRIAKEGGSNASGSRTDQMGY